MTRHELRWRHPEAGRFVAEFAGHTLAAVLGEDGGWVAEVDGEPAKLAHPEMRRRFGRRTEAQDAAVFSLMAPHRISQPQGYCSYAEGLPPGWRCGRDQYWIGHLND